ncbi:MAG: hypothetical protein M1821_009677 [Bathelium mastoideum]|nr:MAG: hypothetical protein M1821_009677 [Bathelium mastoideum]KAI9690564.1 MAG: hypothetical protein M1822_009527 [Bathelium mastoideum]
MSRNDDGENKMAIGSHTEIELKQPGSRCPEYGAARPNNPYGREGSYTPKLGGVLSSRQINSSAPSIPSQSLEFMTFSCTYYLSQPMTPNALETYTSKCFILRDSRNRTCGICHDDHNIFGSGWAFEGHICEVILLSYAAGQSRDRAVYRFANLDIPENYRSQGPKEDDDDALVVLNDEGDIQWDSWDMFNVMLVRPYPDKHHVYERVGIGVLHENAVTSSLDPVCYKRIILY